MITLKEFLETIEYKITEGSEYLWDCYGDTVHRIERQTSDHNGNTVTCVFDTNDHFLYELEAWDNSKNRVYRWIHPAYIKQYKKCCKKHGVKFKNAYDDVNYIDLEVEADILDKARAIAREEEYDERVQIEVDFSDEELLQYMKLAHERDMTFNELVEEALRCAIDDIEAGRLTKEDAQRYIRERYENNSSV
jgi:hypothetical protein